MECTHFIQHKEGSEILFNENQERENLKQKIKTFNYSRRKPLKSNYDFPVVKRKFAISR